MLFYLTWCGHYYCTPQYVVQRDSFSAILLAYICNGTLQVTYDGKTFNARSGDIVLLDCCRPHRYSGSYNLEFFYANFAGANSFDICNYLIEQYGPLIQRRTNRLLEISLAELVYFYQQGKIESMTNVSERIFHFFDILLSPDIDDATRLMMYRAADYIRNNVGKDITLPDLANIAQMSTFHFAHVFKKYTGFSPIEYVINTRIDRAKALLLRTTDTVEQIAYKVGYNASSSFITIFTRRTGMTPSAYRKHQLGHN